MLQPYRWGIIGITGNATNCPIGYIYSSGLQKCTGKATFLSSQAISVQALSHSIIHIHRKSVDRINKYKRQIAFSVWRYDATAFDGQDISQKLTRCDTEENPESPFFKETATVYFYTLWWWFLMANSNTVCVCLSSRLVINVENVNSGPK